MEQVGFVREIIDGKVELEINIPPKALSGSPARAAEKASEIVSLCAIPQTLVCLITANVAGSAFSFF